jgi:thiol-disulfide isomerase/thioredoxin
MPRADPLQRVATERGEQMSRLRNFTVAAFWMGAALSCAASAPSADLLAGRWDGVVTIHDVAIPFRLDFSGDGADFTGSLFNGDIPVTPTRAYFENGTAVLNFDQLLVKLTATIQDGQLEGRIEGRFAGAGGAPFQARRYSPPPPSAGEVPSIGGLWEIAHETVKGEKAWRFIVRQSGPEVTAAILRVDGDTGSLTGRWRAGKFVLSHFDGTRPALMEITPAADGSLTIEQPSGRDPKLIAYRVEEARAKGVPEPADFAAHTTVRNPNQPFTFRFADANGKVWSNQDPKFKGKVLLVNITGTWCPNCHDEAPYLEELYKKYRSRGLEIVALDFEEPEQRAELSRARAFVRKYGIEYTYLIAGAPDELQQKVTQLENLNTWPATIFIGRDGRVRAVHAGFAAPASGDFYRQLDREYTSIIERLLGEDRTADAAARSAAK